MNLFEANAQWSKRPDDERFSSIEEMGKACESYARESINGIAQLGDLRVEADSGNLLLVGKSRTAASLSHFGFGQLARLADAPAGYLRRLPATLAAQNINHGLAKADVERSVKLLLHKRSSGLIARAITGDMYDRVWNFEIVNKISQRLTPNGWRVPPARPAREGQAGTRRATAADILPNQGDFGLAIKEGDLIAPAGLYASDHDMFAFLVNHENPVFDGSKFLNRGVFIQNSEVGDCALRFKIFTYDNVCGNHIVWGVGKVAEVSVRHIKGGLDAKGRTLQNALNKWEMMSRTLPSADEMEGAIKAARSREIGGTKDEVLDAVFGFAKARGLQALSRETIKAGYELAEKTPRYGAPTTVWGMVNGLTEVSQTLAGAHTDTRVGIDTQAGRLMDMAF